MAGLMSVLKVLLGLNYDWGSVFKRAVFPNLRHFECVF